MLVSATRTVTEAENVADPLYDIGAVVLLSAGLALMAWAVWLGLRKRRLVGGRVRSHVPGTQKFGRSKGGGGGGQMAGFSCSASASCGSSEGHHSGDSGHSGGAGCSSSSCSSSSCGGGDGGGGGGGGD